MSSIIVCPDCKRKLKVPETMAGKSFRCPGCKAVLSTSSGIRAAEDDPDRDESDTPDPSRAVKTAPSPRSAAALPRSRPPREEELEEDIEPEEEQPSRAKPPRKKRPIKKKSSTGLIIGLVAGGVVLLLLVLGGGGGALWYFVLRNKGIPQSEWQSFSPPNSGCTILMPGTPAQQSLNILGLTAKTYQVDRKKEDSFFVVTIFDVSPLFLRPSLLDDVANSSRDGAKAKMDGVKPGGKVVSESAISLGNLPGREYQIKPPPPDRGTFISRLYLAKVGDTHRIFLLMAGGSSIQPNAGDAARFFDSFKLDASAMPPNLDAAAQPGGAKLPPGFNPPPTNPQPNAPRPNPGRRPPRMPSPRT